MIQELPVLIYNIQVRAVAIVVLTKQIIENIFLL